jgi:hypothetical protein
MCFCRFCCSLMTVFEVHLHARCKCNLESHSQRVAWPAVSTSKDSNAFPTPPPPPTALTKDVILIHYSSVGSRAPLMTLLIRFAPCMVGLFWLMDVCGCPLSPVSSCCRPNWSVLSPRCRVASGWCWVVTGIFGGCIPLSAHSPWVLQGRAEVLSFTI